MKLSDSEQEALIKLEKKAAIQYRLRWVFLVFGVLLIGMSLGLSYFHLLTGTLSWVKTLMETPLFYLQAICGGLSIGMSIKGFKGDPQLDLLIKVVNELREKDS